MKKLIVVADDMGIAPEINRGILQSHREGIVTSTALLVNAPATEEALHLLDQEDSLEVGLHLSFVEGISLSQNSSLVSSYDYFPNEPCLHENWKKLLSQYVFGKLCLSHLEDEVNLQFEKFKKWRGSIPFMNGTQHIHLFPPFQNIVVQACKSYGVSQLRLPVRGPARIGISGRKIQLSILAMFARTLKSKLTDSGVDVHSPEYFFGFEQGGALDLSALCSLVENLPKGTSEIMSHPGYYSPLLKDRISGYRDYDWQIELSALTDKKVRAIIDEKEISLINFQHLLQ